MLGDNNTGALLKIRFIEKDLSLIVAKGNEQINRFF